MIFSPPGLSKTIADSRYILGTVTPIVSHAPNIILGNAGVDAIASDVGGGIILGAGYSTYNNIIGGDGSLTVGTVTGNVTSMGTTANVSVIGGYDNVAGAISSKIISDHSYVAIQATTGHNAIYGGSNNAIIGLNTGHAGIFSGYHCNVSGLYSFAEGAYNNAFQQGAIAMGTSNTSNGTGTVTIGAGNTALGIYSFAFGSTNQTTVQATYAEAFGFYALAKNSGYRVQSIGKINVVGDAQTGVGTFYGQTTDGVTTVKLNPTNWTMQNNQTILYNVNIVARASGGVTTTHGAWIIKGAAHWDNLDWGISSGGNDSTHIYDTTKSWATNVFVGKTVAITSGTGTGLSQVITANSSTGITVGNWSTVPDSTSTYIIYGSNAALGNPLVETIYNPNSIPTPTIATASSIGNFFVNVVGLPSTTIGWVARVTLTEVSI